jgi:murein DD-endopeptidase MepM/ murein hydrolase activator NlpD
MKLPLYYPVKPLGINQGFGNDPAYYAKFKDAFGNPLQGHDGVDFRAPHGTPVYAAHDGLAQYQEDAHGGCGFVITTTDTFDYGGTEAKFQSIYWHMIGKGAAQQSPAIATDGSLVPVKAGDLLGYADNTGAPYESSGDHLHFGLVPLNAEGGLAEAKNGFNGRIDPTPYFTDFLAQDIPKLLTLEEELIPMLKEEIQLLWQRLTLK